MRCILARVVMGTVLLSAIASPPVTAANPDTQVPGVPMIKQKTPGAELTLLESLVGTWRVTEHWEPWEGMTPGGEGSGIQTVAAGPGQMSIAIAYQAIEGPFSGYRAQGIMSWEADGRELPFRAAWSQSATPGISVETGRMEGRDLVMSYEVVERGTPYTVRNVYSKLTHDSYVVSTYFIDRAGEVRKVLALDYVRDRH